MKKTFFSVQGIKILLKQEGAHAVSKESAVAISDLIEEYARLIARKAIKKALYNGRKTVKKEDIEPDKVLL